MSADAPTGAVVLLLTSPRTAPGLLSWPAWNALREADAVLAAGLDPLWTQAFAEAGITAEDLDDVPVAHRAGRLVADAVAGRRVLWFGSPDADPGLTDALAQHLSRHAVTAPPPEIEVLTGSHDVPGSRLLDLVAVMDRLRSPGGCPWDAEQTHESLLPYVLEETHEVIEAVESGDREHLAEELGDLLLQVTFHARVAAEHPSAPFDIDDVAGGIVAKLVRRHPHVFGADGDEGSDATTTEQVEANWDQLKQAEKQREGVFDGIPVSLPALARAQKMLSRWAKAGGDPAAVAAAAGDDEVAAALLTAVERARTAGVDAEGALRTALHRLVPPSAGTMGA